MGVDKDAVSCVADRDDKRRSLEVRDDGDSGLAEWYAEKVSMQQRQKMLTSTLAHSPSSSSTCW